MKDCGLVSETLGWNAQAALTYFCRWSDHAVPPHGFSIGFVLDPVQNGLNSCYPDKFHVERGAEHDEIIISWWTWNVASIFEESQDILRIAKAALVSDSSSTTATAGNTLLNSMRFKEHHRRVVASSELPASSQNFVCEQLCWNAQRAKTLRWKAADELVCQENFASFMAQQLQSLLQETYCVDVGTTHHELDIRWWTWQSDFEKVKHKVLSVAKDIVEENFVSSNGKTGRNILGSIRFKTRRDTGLEVDPGVVNTEAQLPLTSTFRIASWHERGTQDMSPLFVRNHTLPLLSCGSSATFDASSPAVVRCEDLVVSYAW